MADPTLALTGDGVKIELLFNGFPQKLIDCVTRFTAEARFQEREGRYLGTTDVDVDQRPDGWAGEIEVERKNGQLDDFMDQYRLLQKSGLPFIVIITANLFYRDGSNRLHIFQDCKINYSLSASRGEAVTSRLTWRSGKERV